MSSRRAMFSLVSASNLASCAALMAWISFAMVPGGASRWDGFVLDEGDFGHSDLGGGVFRPNLGEESVISDSCIVM